MTQKSIKKNGLQAGEIAEINDIKRKFELELAQGEIVRKELIEKLFKFRRENESASKRVETKKEHLAKMKLKFIELEQKIKAFDEPVHRVKAMIEDFKQNLAEDIEMKEFYQESMRLVNTYREAMQFYSEERLMLELSKRKKSLNDRRVAVTELDAAVAKKKENIQLKKAEIEKEIERKKQEEAAKQARINEENAKRLMAAQFHFTLNDSSSIGSEKPFVRPVTPRCENYKSFRKTPSTIASIATAAMDTDKKIDEEFSFSQNWFSYKM